MNEQFIIILGVLALYCVINMMTGCFDDNSDFRPISVIICAFAFVLGLLFSGILAIGETKEQVKPATNTRVGDELIIQAEGFPSQVISDMKFIGKEVQVKEIKYHNAWGGGLETKYEVEIID